MELKQKVTKIIVWAGNQCLSLYQFSQLCLQTIDAKMLKSKGFSIQNPKYVSPQESLL